MNKGMYMMKQTSLTNAAPGVLLLRVPGITDSAGCERFDTVIAQALAARPRTVVVDLSAADSVSTVVLGSLLKLRRGIVAIGGEVRLAGVQPLVRRVLNICRLDQLFNVFSSAEEALAADKTAEMV
jgi:serine/threonine-protein kinase RsbW